MKSHEFITEASADYRARMTASKELHDIYRSLTSAKTEFAGDINATAKRAKELIKIAGRTGVNYVNGFKKTDGQIYDSIITALTRLQQNQGHAISFPAGTGTVQSFKDHLAMYFKGFNAKTRSFMARRWTMGNGGTYKDPEHGLQFPTKDERDAAMEEIEKHAKKVYTRDPYNKERVQTFYKIGKFLLSPSTPTRGVFGNTPDSEYLILIQTSGIMRNPLTAKVDITDQQAARLTDIAATKTANVMDKLQAIVNVLRGEQDMKRIIDASQKITPQDKAKLDAIIAGASNFKEP